MDYTLNKVNSASYFPTSVSDGKYYLGLFILWPFLAFIVALFNYSRNEARKVVYIFSIYYGLTLVVSSIYIDAARTAVRLREYALLSFSDFTEIIGGLYTTDTVDIAEPILAFLVSRFTTYHGVLFAAIAALFGFFYLKSINLLHDRLQKKPDMNALIHLTFFAFINPITAINGFRFYTAAWIFFYGAYHVILFKDKKFLLLALSSVLVHFSFMMANVILLVYFVAGNRNIIYLPFAIASFIIPHFIAPFIESISMKLGGGLEERYIMYSNENYIEVVRASYDRAAWFMSLYSNLVYYYILFAIAVIQLKFRHLMNKNEDRNVFSFILLFLSFYNFAKVIPTLGRFSTILYLFSIVYIFLFFLKLPGKNIKPLTWIGLFPMLLFIAVRIRQGSDTLNALIFAPGLGMPLFGPGITVTDLIF